MTGRTLSHYEILDRIGSGGMGEIYRARDSRLNRTVAVKVLPASDAADDKRRQRFIQEAQAASGLSHPNIVTIHDILHEEGADLMVMELIGGSTLSTLIPQGGLPVHDVLKFGVQIASALAAAHAAGIVHRDIKPGNIMVTPTGLVKVLDFGLAKPTFADMAGGGDDATRSFAAPLTVQGSVLGTINYMSPEQAEGKPLDPRSDIFSFGIVLYEMITGRTAFGRDSLVSSMTAILRDEVAPIREIAPAAPARLIGIVDKCLKKDRDQRWASMEDVRRELESVKLLYDTGSAATLPVALPAIAQRPAKKSKAAPVIVLSAVVLAAAGGLGWWMFGRGGQPATPAAEHQVAQTQPPAQPEATPAPPAAQPPAAADGVLTNDAVVDMVQAKVPLATIAGQIHSSKTRFDLSTAQVIRLSKAGVPATVIEMMRNPAAAAAPSASPASAPAPAPTTPTATPPLASNATPSAPAGSSSVVALSDGLPISIELAEDVPAAAASGAPLHFRTTAALVAGGVTIIPKGAAVIGQIAEEGKKRLVGSSRATFELIEADGADGQKIKLRATPALDKGSSRRPLDSKKKTKDLAAPAGSEFVAYVNGQQTVTVRK